MDDYFHVSATQASVPSKLKLTYTATLQYGNETTTVPIDPDDFGTENLALEAAQKMWSCMIQGGVPTDNRHSRSSPRSEGNGLQER
jgi:hypothetical protein